ncbi:MAG: PqqD family protein [Microthrixaceae bacterium]|nr:PqqD family protein [Microthrixaceae bacterium]
MTFDPNNRRGLEPDTRPRLRSDIAMFGVDGGLVMASESVGRIVMLDQVSGTIIQLMDGAVSLSELAEDLAELTGLTFDEALTRVLSIAIAVDLDGYFVDSTTPLNERRVNVPVPGDSCLGRQMGLNRGWIAQVRSPWAAPFRFGATVDTVVDDLVDDLRGLGCEVDAPDDQPSDLLFLRATQGRVPRLQQLFDTIDIRWYADRNYDAGISALRSSVFSRAELNKGAWLEGMSLRSQDRVILVHPSLAESAHAARIELGAVGVSPTAGGLLRIDGDHLVLPGDRSDTSTGTDTALQPAGIVMPSMDDFSIRRAAFHLCRSWNQVHLDAFGPIVSTLPTIIADSDGFPVSKIQEHLYPA